MRSKSINCIVLGNKNFGEKHKLVFLYCQEFGKLQTIAKGARSINSKFTGHIETLTIASATIYFGPKNIILSDINTQESCQTMEQNLETVLSALQIAEILNKFLYENQNIDGVMQLLIKTIRQIPTSKKPLLTTMGFIVKFLDIVGIIPDFKENHFELEEKYIKFFEFAKTHELNEMEKITLEDDEAFKITRFLKKLIEHETQSSLLTFTTPVTFSSLSKRRSNLSTSPRSRIK